MTHSNTNFSRGGQTYQSPSLEVLDVLVEGILCTSDGFDSPSYGYDDDNDLGEI